MGRHSIEPDTRRDRSEVAKVNKFLYILALVVLSFMWGCTSSAENTKLESIENLDPEPVETQKPNFGFEFVADIQFGKPRQGHDGLVGHEYNDVWGYANPEADTYLVFLGKQEEIAIIDVYNPKEPKILSIVEVPFHVSNHDLFVYSHYLYVVTESNMVLSGDTRPGLQIIDFSDPNNPKVSFYEGSFRSAHTIFVDEKAKRLYVSGVDRGADDLGIRILDISDPLHPKDLGGYSGIYIHEVYARDGLVYAAEIGAGQVEILDTRNPLDIKKLAAFPSPWHSAHSVWLTEDGKHLIVADENHRVDYWQRKVFRKESGFSIYDISNIEANNNNMLQPPLLSRTSLPGTTVHQIYILGDLLFVSWYTEGVKVFDISNPAEPVEVARFDTSKLSSNYPEFGGAWGLWPYDPRGEYVYVSDMEEGLIILRLQVD